MSKFWNKWINAIKQRYCIPGSLKLKEQFTLDNWVKPLHKLTHTYEWIFARLLEVYNNLKTYSCKEITQSTFAIVKERFNQHHHLASDSFLVFIQNDKFSISIDSPLEPSRISNPTTFSEHCTLL